MPNVRSAGDVIDDLQAQLHDREREIADLRAGLRNVQLIGIAVGVLLARTPGWTEHDALAAWERACDRFTRDGNTIALASYVVQTGQLPGEGVHVAV